MNAPISSRVDLQALPLLLGLTSVVALGLLAFRVYHTGSASYGFLAWNLFLAWVPVWLAEGVRRIANRAPAGQRVSPAVFGVGLLWLLFLPNAPYLLTEFIHLTPTHAHLMHELPARWADLGPRAPVPAWFDVLMIVVYAWNGLLLGFVSLHIVQGIVRRHLGRAWGWGVAAVTLVLCGFGVSLGRFERWNSWDLFGRPRPLLADVLSRVTDPLNHPRTAGTTLILSAFLLLAYATGIALTRLPQGEPSM